MVQRRSISIFYTNDVVLQSLDKKELHIYYTSKKDKYAILYYDAKNENRIIESLKNNHGITSVLNSEIKYEKYNF